MGELFKDESEAERADFVALTAEAISRNTGLHIDNEDETVKNV